MIAVIRIHGQVKLKEEIINTLDRLKIRRKLACVLIDEKDTIRMGMVMKVKDFVTYGKIDDKLKDELEKKRGEKDFKTGKLKPFFRLHPPIGGFKKSTKQAYTTGKGILGENKDIAKLLVRML